MPPKRTTTSQVRLAACEPCRESKVACDHLQPVCTRCQERDVTASCVYRPRPFKRRRDGISIANSTNLPNASTSHPASAIPYQSPPSIPPNSPTAASPPDIAKSSPHPNPGYLGSSSYLTIFEQMTTNGTSVHQTQISNTPQSAYNESRSPPSRVSPAIIAEGVRILEQIRDSKLFPACTKLMDEWFARGSNIALGSDFAQECVQATCTLVSHMHRFPLIDISRSLSQASNNPLATYGELSAFVASFTGTKPRWETLALCFLMLPRATFFIETLDSVFTTMEERRQFRKRVIYFSDHCLEIALSLDCLNDLQLFVQYENFIAHSYVDGDQSYASWRKIGDVASSLYALGYHEDVTGGQPPVSEWLQSLRRSAVARAYSADKNVAIFLGRPPRIHRKFFSQRVLGQIAMDLDANVGEEIWHMPEMNHPKFCYDVDTWWSAMCARLKEEALDLSRDTSQDEQARKASIILEHAAAQWRALPAHYYLIGPLKNHSSDPKERDFVVGAKLNHLHVYFITCIAQARFIPEPSHQLVSVSATMLSMVTEALMLRHYLKNSGTTLMWKLIYYGLPAAGIVCLYLLDRSSPDKFRDVSRTKALQDLNVLVAEIESQAFTDNEDPNYDLLSSATRTMQAIIEKYLSGDFARSVQPRSTMQLEDISGMDLAWSNNLNLQDFETDFWLSLADHPALGG